jgi:hypothetical protein
MIMRCRTILAVVLGSFWVLANAAPSPAFGWRHLFGGNPGSSCGCSGMFSRSVPLVEEHNNDTVPVAACPGDVPMTPLMSRDGVPGTLGLTYQQRTKRVNSDIHPRVGLLEITVSDATFRHMPSRHDIKVTVADEAGHFEELEGYFGEDDKWHFESKPLYPGIPHIYDVKFEEMKLQIKRERKYDKIVESEVEKKIRDLGVRRVRLIPGRIVFLNYP